MPTLERSQLAKTYLDRAQKGESAVVLLQLWQDEEVQTAGMKPLCFTTGSDSDVATVLPSRKDQEEISLVTLAMLSYIPG